MYPKKAASNNVLKIPVFPKKRTQKKTKLDVAHFFSLKNALIIASLRKALDTSKQENKKTRRENPETPNVKFFHLFGENQIWL